MRVKTQKIISLFVITFVVAMLVGSPSAQISSAGKGNPLPGTFHQKLVFNVGDEKPVGFSTGCGGHAIHLKGIFLNGKLQSIPPTQIEFSMINWYQIDNDNDGLFDEDPADGIDNDGDFRVDEDPVEPGNETMSVDCDARGDAPGTESVSVIIADNDPRKAYVSTPVVHMRTTGNPNTELTITTAAAVWSCEVSGPGPDGVLGTADDTYTCTQSEFLALGTIDLTEECDGKAIKDVSTKKGGQGGSKKANGKTEFCNVTHTFEVDVDFDGDGTLDCDTTAPDGTPRCDIDDANIFSLSCENNPETIRVDEDPLDCAVDDSDGDGMNGEDPPGDFFPVGAPDGFVNDDFDCTSLDGLTHYFGNPFDFIADECYDGENQFRDADRIETIDEDALLNDPLICPIEDRDGDGIDGEDPVDGIDNDRDSVNETLNVCPLGSAFWTTTEKNDVRHFHVDFNYPEEENAKITGVTKDHVKGKGHLK